MIQSRTMTGTSPLLMLTPVALMAAPPKHEGLFTELTAAFYLSGWM